MATLSPFLQLLDIPALLALVPSTATTICTCSRLMLTTAVVVGAHQMSSSHASLKTQAVVQLGSGNILHLAMSSAIRVKPPEPPRTARVGFRNFGLIPYAEHISGCIIEHNIEYWMDDEYWGEAQYGYIGGRKVANQEDCSVFCESSSGCRFWTWASNGGCMVFSSDSGRTEKPEWGAVSGNAQCGKGTFVR